ncbi:MAG: hypothetical protein JST35_04175 [Armatimonadetes bacterium]|nr:hypothetical protein [Armatimonadota bacterium]
MQGGSSIERFLELTGVRWDPAWTNGLHNPEAALLRTLRWLEATSQPANYGLALTEQPEAAERLIRLIGTSGQQADVLAQNPEFASIAFEPIGRKSEAQHRLDADRLLSQAISPSHELDRLRYLKQRETFRILLADLNDLWPQPEVWEEISDLASAIIQSTVISTWRTYQRQHPELPEAPPLTVVGFGKLAGRELNYSSDVDLAYFTREEFSEAHERKLTRYCEVLTRAISDPMGRGALYRVDLRLRPYGAAGPVCRTLGSAIKYYQRFAEAWERQALVRSKVLFDLGDAREQWTQLRREEAFRRAWSPEDWEAWQSMRAATHALGQGDDLKRGPGGIRDIEFFAQVHQLLQGANHPELQVTGTLDALAAAVNVGEIPAEVGGELAIHYTEFRKVEHRLQLDDNLQTHELPSTEEGWARLAAAVRTGDDLQAQLNDRRERVRSLTSDFLGHQTSSSPRALFAAACESESAAGLQWIDALPGAELFYEGIIENEGSLARVKRILEEAPELVPFFRDRVVLTEMLLSGEIEEEHDGLERIANIPLDMPLEKVAEIITLEWFRTCGQWVIRPDRDLAGNLSSLIDVVIRYAARRFGYKGSILALGSLGSREMVPDSDADLIFLAEDRSQQAVAEESAKEVLAFFAQLRRAGMKTRADARLRPDGGKGLLVRSYDGFRAYEVEAMEMWERFALVPSRLIFGAPEAETIVRQAAFAQPLTPERLSELKNMKRRIENERLNPQHRNRNVKLGHGGLSDIEWFVQLHEMRYPGATRAAQWASMPDRILRLGQARLIHAVEIEELLSGFQFLRVLRARLGLLSIRDDLVPENPTKLQLLGRAMGLGEPNQFLGHYEKVTTRIRSILEEGLERLRS